MKKVLHLAAALIVALVASTSALQAQNVGFRYHITPKAGQAAGFEAAVREHIAYRVANGDTWNWAFLEYVAGEDDGSYLAISNGHSYADMDSYDQSLFVAHFRATVSPLVESMWQRFNITDPVINNPTPSTPELFSVTTYHVKPSETVAFDEVLTLFHTAVTEANYPAYFTVNRPAMGGASGTVNIVTQAENWAGLDPESPDIVQFMINHYGQERASEIFTQFLGSYSHAEEYLLQARPDLSTPTDNN